MKFALKNSSSPRCETASSRTGCALKVGRALHCGFASLGRKEVWMIARGAHAGLLVDPRPVGILWPPHRPPQHHPDPVGGQMPGAQAAGNTWQFTHENWLSNRVFNSSTTSSITVARHGTSSSIYPGGSCPSALAIGPWVVINESWYYPMRLKVCGLKSVSGPRRQPLGFGGAGLRVRGLSTVSFLTRRDG
jgi:hypothetical protein